MSGGRGVRGNREVSPLLLLGPRGDLSGARAEATHEEGGSWGKHGFPHGSEPKASDAGAERAGRSEQDPLHPAQPFVAAASRSSARFASEAALAKPRGSLAKARTRPGQS